MTGLDRAKAGSRAAARARRARLGAAHPDAGLRAAPHLLRAVEEAASVASPGIVSAYLPVRDEIDPLPAARLLHDRGWRVCMPAVVTPGEPLRFRAWSPGARLVEVARGLLEPAEGDWLVPRILVVPLLAFDRRGNRLGYGGGFYDRTLAALRAGGPAVAIGLAYSGQEVADLPVGETDAPLDAVVTEAGIILPAGGGA